MDCSKRPGIYVSSLGCFIGPDTVISYGMKRRVPVDYVAYGAVLFDSGDTGEGCLNRICEKKECNTHKIPFHRIVIVFL